MKNLRLALVLPLILFMMASATAQIRFGPLVGRHIANLDLKEADSLDIDFSSREGWGVGAALEFDLGRHLDVRLEPMYLEKGAEKQTDDPELGSIESTLHLKYAELPALLKLSLNKGGINPYVVGGLTVARLLDAKEEMGDEFVEMGFEKERDVTDEIKGFDFGLTYGAGLSIPFAGWGFFAEGRYSRGLSDINDAPEHLFDVKTKGWQFLGGVVFEIGGGGGAVPAQQKDGEKESSRRTRTRHGKCTLEAEFGLRVLPPRSTGDERDVLFTELLPGIKRMDSNGRLAMKIKDVRVCPYPGTITIVFRRGPAGTDEFVRFTKRVANDGELQAFLKASEAPIMNAPTGMSPDNNRITERLRAEVDYDPETTPDDCKPIRAELTITWYFNASPRNFVFKTEKRLKKRISVPKHRSRVEAGSGIVDETTGFNGKLNKATHTAVFFDVDEPFGCCGIANKHYTIIQFVRHRWNLAGKKGGDDWNLDGPDSQSDMRKATRPYDPTYTTDPAHGRSTADEDNELVHVGPWDGSGGSAVIVDDFPGLFVKDHEVFKDRGGWFEWEFVTLLVCKEAEGSAEHYLASGKVRAKTRFAIRRTYPGGNKPPIVKGRMLKGKPEGKREYYDPCKDLAEVLRKTELLAPFNNPRPH
jgi:opacity protein-like surface antigen